MITIYCQHCGKEIADDAVVCIHCGREVKAFRGSKSYAGQKSRIAAGLLGIFLGGIGAHRFYLGYTGIGIAQIFVTLVTLGIGSLWGFIEGILILTGSFNQDANGMPLRD